MKIYLVGGAVRDKLLGLPVKERDWVVVGANPSDMLKLGYRQVGKEFPVFLHPDTHEEYALARLERKVKPGYKGFVVDTSPAVTLEDDLVRRDLTINAMAETLTGEIIDPYHGKNDLIGKILRHISPAFSEDPVRILRVGRFLARFAHQGFHVAPETIELMRHMVIAGEVNALVAERVWKELERALGEKNPEQFFTVLEDCHALPVLFPALTTNTLGMPALIAAAALTQAPIIRFAALLHSLSKPDILTICHRYKVPNAYQELAILIAAHHDQALLATTLSANALLQLFATLDIFRRAKRFDDFIMACVAIASAKKQQFNPEWLSNAANVAKSVDVQALLSAGFTGHALATQLKIARQEKIAHWLGSSGLL